MDLPGASIAVLVREKPADLEPLIVIDMDPPPDSKDEPERP